MLRPIFGLALCAALLWLACFARGASTEPSGRGIVVPLWADLRPATSPSEDRIEYHAEGAIQQRSMFNVTHPQIEVFLPPAQHRTGAAVICCPGGGWTQLDVDKEGQDAADFFVDHGIAGIVLKYRLPSGEAVRGLLPFPLQDAQRAVRLVRLHAGEWGIDPKRVGVIGFSAGGFVAAAVSTHNDPGDSGAADAADRLSSRPDFAILCYPGITLQQPLAGRNARFLGDGATQEMVEEYSNELHVTAQTPPTFLVLAADDAKADPQQSVQYFAALLKNKVHCEMHIFAQGGHGFGMGIRGGEPANWPLLLLPWFKAEKILAD